MKTFLIVLAAIIAATIIPWNILILALLITLLIKIID
jgi:hypothetical protein